MCRTAQSLVGISENITAQHGRVRLSVKERIAIWENEGGSVTGTSRTMKGTVNQIAWANQIRGQVDAEFDRVASALQSVAARQTGKDQRNTHAMISILEDKRSEVMANTEAGYFIHDWQELRDQVRQMIINDDRYKAMKPAKVKPGSGRG
jgi:hypothetical protein